MFLEYTTRELLRLHVEAVWGVRLSPITENEMELLPGGAQPEWGLYVAELEDERISIWQTGLESAVRASLLERMEEVLRSSSIGNAGSDISREVALHQVGQPVMDREAARQIARPIKPGEYALLETFEPGAGAYFSAAGRGPLFGVVREGRLECMAHSSRRTAEACELGIDTRLEARRQGYALAATMLWADAVRQEGLVPIYSALAENTASLKLAAAAGYRAFARGISIAYDKC